MEKRIFNYWRINLRITTFAEVCNNFGDQINPEYLNYYSFMAASRQRREIWPNQEAPSITKFGIWRRIIILLANCNNGIHLTQPLGPWYEEELNKHNHWFMLHHTKDLITISNLDNDKWKRHPIHHILHTHMYFDTTADLYTRTVDLSEYIIFDVVLDDQHYYVNPRKILKTMQVNQPSTSYSDTWIRKRDTTHY
jgi:hypothetical protein